MTFFIGPSRVAPPLLESKSFVPHRTLLCTATRRKHPRQAVSAFTANGNPTTACRVVPHFMLSHVFTTPILRETTSLTPQQLAGIRDYLLTVRGQSAGDAKSNRGGWHSPGNLF